METKQDWTAEIYYLLIPGGCRRNATIKFSKTANTARAPILTHVAARRQSRLRSGIYETTTHSSKTLKTTNFLRLLLVIMTINMFVQQRQVEAASTHRRKTETTTDLVTTTQHFSKAQKIFLKEICSEEIKWKNACKGVYVPNSRNSSSGSFKHGRVYRLQALKLFKDVLSKTYQGLKNQTREIDSRSKNVNWTEHKSNYRFLPRLKHNSTLKLRSWHRKAQIYAGAFEYLRNAQLHFDLKKFDEERNISRTLKKFRDDALTVICELETTINMTSKRKRSLHYINPVDMTKKFKYHSETQYFYNIKCKEHTSRFDELADPIPPSEKITDLHFTMRRYLSFIRAMRKIVTQKIASNGSFSSSSSNSSSNSRSRSRYSSGRSDNNYSDSATSGSKYPDSSVQSLSRSEKLPARRHHLRRHHKRISS